MSTSCYWWDRVKTSILLQARLYHMMKERQTSLPSDRCWAPLWRTKGLHLKKDPVSWSLLLICCFIRKCKQHFSLLSGTVWFLLIKKKQVFFIATAISIFSWLQPPYVFCLKVFILFSLSFLLCLFTPPGKPMFCVSLSVQKHIYTTLWVWHYHTKTKKRKRMIEWVERQKAGDWVQGCASKSTSPPGVFLYVHDVVNND